MRCVIETVLHAPADRVWQPVLRPKTLERVTRGLLGFSDASFPERWSAGVSVSPRLVFFPALPAWKHHLTIEFVDHETRALGTREGGGRVRTWSHRITVQPRDAASCFYRDTIDISAGLLTPLVRIYSELFYRYRQLRLRRLIDTLARSA